MALSVHILSIHLFRIVGLNSVFVSSGVASSHVLVYLNILVIVAYRSLFRCPCLNNIEVQSLHICNRNYVLSIVSLSQLFNTFNARKLDELNILRLLQGTTCSCPLWR